MNAHRICIVEGPLAGDALAANNAVFDLPRSRSCKTGLSLVPAPAENNPSAPESNADDVEPAKTTEQDDYIRGGYAGI
ncbi:MAG: hypothetical protein P4L92_15535 [Rudaea sp.]|nr:hypothetical protein [Rudaea sp.]